MEVVGTLATVGKVADLAAKVFSALYEYLRKVKAAPARSKELRDELLTISDVLRELNTTIRTYSELTASVLHRSVEKFCVLLKDLEKRFTQPVTKLERFKWPLSEKENTEYLLKIQRFVGYFNLALTGSHTYTCSGLLFG